MKAIMGLVPPTGGRISPGGRDITGARPHAICRAGVACVPEEREVFANLTVDENLRMGEQRAAPGATRWTVDDMFAWFPRLKERRNTRAGSLSGGEQPMLTLCRSLLGNPRVILIDEPTEGLAPRIVAAVADCIRRPAVGRPEGVRPVRAAHPRRLRRGDQHHHRRQHPHDARRAAGLPAAGQARDVLATWAR
jgi:ABC-type branched-subunit amino acid transport system ATPase component